MNGGEGDRGTVNTPSLNQSSQRQEEGGGSFTQEGRKFPSLL